MASLRVGLPGYGAGGRLVGTLLRAGHGGPASGVGVVVRTTPATVTERLVIGG